MTMIQIKTLFSSYIKIIDIAGSSLREIEDPVGYIRALGLKNLSIRHGVRS